MLNAAVFGSEQTQGLAVLLFLKDDSEGFNPRQLLDYCRKRLRGPAQTQRSDK